MSTAKRHPGPTRPITGLILAGGRATRMGGGDKALLDLNGRPVLAHLIDRLAPQVAALMLNANGDAARFASFDLPVHPDPVPGLPGPLAGLLAGLDWAAAQGHGTLVSCAADTPFVPRDLVTRLAKGGAFALAASPDDTGEMRLHPTIGLWPVTLRDALRAALAAGERRVGAWARRQGAVEVVFPEQPDPFFNINTPDDLTAARRRALFENPGAAPHEV